MIKLKDKFSDKHKIICLEPSTFYTEDKDISIYDDLKNIFFYHPNKENSIQFNLPVGIFYTKNKIKRSLFQPYEKFDNLPLSDAVSNFRPVVKKNPNKATINNVSKTITVDPSISEHIYKPCSAFIAAHEIGHLHYGGNKYDTYGNLIFNAEKACDDYAINYMLSHGWNPSQIKILKQLILKDEDRKHCIHTRTTNYNFRR